MQLRHLWSYYRPLTLPPFYPILDTCTARRHGISPEAACAALLDGGARIVQFREKGNFTRDRFAAAESIAELCARRNALLVINDRVDVALLLNAAAHLGQDDLPPEDARRIAGTQMAIGFSTHNEQQLRDGAKEPVDYLAMGPIFGTTSKQNPDPVVGVEQLQRLRPLSAKPLVAVGGITRSTAPAVREAGADCVAVIGDLWPEDATPATLRQRTEEWVRLLEK